MYRYLRLTQTKTEQKGPTIRRGTVKTETVTVTFPRFAGNRRWPTCTRHRQSRSLSERRAEAWGFTARWRCRSDC